MAYHQSRFGHCDSYWVEQDEHDAFYAMKAEQRERARALARMEQRALAEHLSNTTAAEYKEDVLAHMERMEHETLPDVNSIDIQTEIQWFMRPFLLDFLIEAHQAFQLFPDTLFLAVNLLDRYCSRRVVYKRHYQLVGCAALLIASKYGDKKDRVPTIKELKSMCCSLYDDEMFLQMEWHVLETLNWVIGHPTIDSFLQVALADAGHRDLEVEHMTLYLCEIALYHKEFVSVRPSTMARSALALARCILQRSPPKPHTWASALNHNVALDLSRHLYMPSPVLSRKYTSMHLSSASTVLEAFLREQVQEANRQRHIAPTPPVMTPLETQRPADAFAAPSTPQKYHQHTAVMQHGCYTPPDTPEHEQFGQVDASYAKQAPMYPRIYAPPTPSPEHTMHTLPPPQSYSFHAYDPRHVQ